MADFQSDLGGMTRSVGEGTGPSVHIETYGCQMNAYDSQAMTGILQRAGFTSAVDLDEADVILINTCSVREHAEHRVISRVGELRRQREISGRPPQILGICGCMAERMGEDLRHGSRPVDLVVGVDNYDKLPEMLGALTGGPAVAGLAVGHRQDVHYVAPPELYPTNNSHLVTIHKGCDYKCTYCIVPYTRGPQSEKHPEAILTEIDDIVAAGGREITLLGQNVTAYRWRDEMDFAGLLRRVAAVPELRRIRFLTGHPRDMHPHLMDTLGELETVCPWLHIPMQSGSDRVLRRMKRLYNRQDYLDMVAQARRVIPDVTFSSDFIVGFPGETEEDFQDTLEVVRQVKYDQIFSFKYSERPGVPAAKLADDVTVEDKKRRLAELMAVQNEIWNDTAAACVGEIWTGVIEDRARRPAGAWRVRTANNRKVIVDGIEPVIGQDLRVCITGHRNTTFLGEIADR